MDYSPKYFKFLGSLLIIFFAMPGAISFVATRCFSDGDCSELNTYCYQQSHFCVPCINCSIYNRYPHPARICAKDKNQCGNCTEGLIDDMNTDGSLSTCYPISNPTISTVNLTSNHQPNESENPKNISWELYITGIGIVTLVIVLCVIIYCLYKTFKSSNYCNRFSFSNAPPPYTEKSPPRSPNAPPYEETSMTLPPSNFNNQACRPIENDAGQTANAFLNPNYVKGGTLGNNHDPDNNEPPNENEDQPFLPSTNITIADDEETNENQEFIPSASIRSPDDEETQPSHWVPQNPLEIPITSFENLNFSQSIISQPNNNNNNTPAIENNPTALVSRSTSEESLKSTDKNSNNSNQPPEFTQSPSSSSGVNVFIQINQSNH